MKNYLLIVLVLSLSACGLFNKKGKGTITVDTDTANAKCVAITDGKKTTCAPISGFEANPNYTYELQVDRVTIPKDSVEILGYDTRYQLVEIVNKQLKDGIYVKIESSMGEILLKLHHKRAPLTVANFVGLAEGSIPNTFRKPGEPYFDGMKFHRVIPNFMVQGGDPNGVGSGGPGYKFKNEIHPDLKHDKPGVMSMANAGPNTNGSQFFITHKATPWLDGSYNIFGQLVYGQDVVTSMAAVPKIGRETPKTPIIMNKVSILRIGDEAEKFDALKTFESLK
jgi:cyclophilin family peptidyl-prolyl cis-trans isomerase